jgi:hypothetical protein
MEQFWIEQEKRGNVRKRPRSGRCMFCALTLTSADIDYAVCNNCWDEKLGEEE